MKKVISILMSCLMSVLFFVSALAPVSATSVELLTTFGSIPLDVKSNFFTNDELISDKMFLIYRQRYNDYCFVNFLNGDCSELVMSNNSSYTVYFKKFDNSYATCDLRVLYFNADGSYRSYFVNNKTSQEIGINGSEVSNGDIDLYVDSIIYSSYPVKFNNNTIYSLSSNKSFEIEDFYKWGSDLVGPQPMQPVLGDYDFIGPLPLIPVEGDPNFDGFKNWLIENKKYEELAKFGLSCTANNIRSLVDYWTGNYNSITGFFNALKTMWSNINVISQAKNIYNWFYEQWELYKKSLITWETYPQEVPSGVTDIEVDEEGNFISSELQYLKLILGVLMAAPQNTANYIYDNLSSVLSSISANVFRLITAVIALPQQTANLIYNNFLVPLNLVLEKIDNVVDAINNIDFSSNNITNNNINVDIDLNNDTDYNISLGDIELTLNNKFAFYSQLTEVKNVFESAEFEEAPPEFEFSSVTLSDGTSLPAFSLDFSLFDKYRTIIHSIIIAVAYLNFFINLLHRLPDVIGGI